jgi:hypothetical protein
MRWILALTSTAGVTGLIAIAGAGGAQAASCSAPFTESRAPTALVATGEKCATARRVATRVAGVAPSGCIVTTKGSRAVKLRSPCVRLGYSCRSLKLKYGKLRVTCTSGARQIRFTY